jgi:Ca-activated chloride channel homolog
MSRSMMGRVGGTTVAGLGLLMAAQLGCADSGLGAAGGPGVTQGGTQDMRYARTIIESGGIPAAEHFNAEGLFSEHDLPLDGDECDQLLCPRAAASWVDPVGPEEGQALVQLGFGTNIGEEFQRRPLSLAVAVDISGSMNGGKLEAVKDALQVMVDQLDEGDELALVVFDDQADLIRGMTVMDAAGRQQLSSDIAALQTDGSTDIEAGLKLAYDQVAPMAGAAGVEDRVFLMTDAQPNVGATGLGSFIGMARFYAESEIGLSVFGVGLDLGSELAQEISTVRGGNYFFLADEDAIAQVFDEEFDYMVTPVAYDLEVVVQSAPGLEFGHAYGAPLDQPGPQVDFGASTLFLSARNGGIGMTLRDDDGVPLDAEGPLDLATFHLSYEPVDFADVVESELAVRWQGGEVIGEQPTLADDLGVYKMAVLVDEYLALMAGADFCEGSISAEVALGRIAEARQRLDGVAVNLGDGPIEDEVALMDKLRINLEGGSNNCAPADQYYY